MKQALTNFGGSRDAYKIVEIGGGYGGLCSGQIKLLPTDSRLISLSTCLG